MTAALIWLIIGIVLIVAEVLSGDFVLLMLGVGALAAAGADAITGNIYVDVAVFAIASTGMLGLVRPALKRRFLSGPGIKTNAEALVGSQAVAMSDVDAHGGQVKLAGEPWSAKALTEGDVIEAGAHVTVVEIQGATAIVSAAI
ncbi:NfeD family protein [Prauserella halophila]|uniref:NfeD family protein n=1 Tax=Prauserella halophila TaxID=185641 RepID=A0ABP4GJQ9_9PSEU|nr:NfeD family protein [Prauserella halophila]MCP2237283.1 Membrane protein implicated in regulation of membrane protease activity [Prauserella halophila]